MNHLMDRLRQPLNETTRKCRRNVLLTSFLGILVSKVGLVPAKISALGVEFSLSNLESLISLLSATIIYFLITFIVYATSEYQGWLILSASKNLDEIKSTAEDKNEYSDELLELKRGFDKQFQSAYKFSVPVYAVRLIVELLVPTAIAIYSLDSLQRFDVTSVLY
tara:strand:+ start:592 stop:1086 length:495 start_codon:yes stop_codon:yes gene_type:complete